MISNNNTNFNLSYHPPNPCLLLLPRSLMLSPLYNPCPFSVAYMAVLDIHLRKQDIITLEMPEQIDWRAKQSSQVACVSEDLRF